MALGGFYGAAMVLMTVVLFGWFLLNVALGAVLGAVFFRVAARMAAIEPPSFGAAFGLAAGASTASGAFAAVFGLILACAGTSPGPWTLLALNYLVPGLLIWAIMIRARFTTSWYETGLVIGIMGAMGLPVVGLIGAILDALLHAGV